MKTFTFSQLTLFVLLGIVSGCGESSSGVAITDNHDAESTKILLTEEPDGATGVTELRDSPWVNGRSAFAVVDSNIELCDDGVCSCCTDKVCDATALIKVVDEHGNLFKRDARDLLKVTQNELVVVSGKAKRDDAGNLTILASGVYVRR